MNRREFERWCALILGFGVVTACSPPPPTEAPVGKRPEVIDGKNQLLAEIEALPDSFVKKYLQERVSPYFRKTPPFTITRDGFKFVVHDATVKETASTQELVQGTFTFRGNKPPQDYRSTAKVTLKVPLMGSLVGNDLSAFPKENTTDDGTVFIKVNYDPNAILFEGVSPQIDIYVPKPEILTPKGKELFKSIARFAYIKEACALLLNDILVEETYKEMKRLGFETETEVSGPSGVQKIETVSQGVAAILNQGKRSLAMIDIASHFIALKAVENDQVLLEQISEDKVFKAVIPTISGVDIGDTTKSLLDASYNWALTTPAARDLPHIGTMDELPLLITPDNGFIARSIINTYNLPHPGFTVYPAPNTSQLTRREVFQTFFPF